MFGNLIPRGRGLVPLLSAVVVIIGVPLALLVATIVMAWVGG